MQSNRKEISRKGAKIDELPAADWNRLVDADSPFLRHEFLAALERHDCPGERLGWLPRHLALRDEAGRLVAAAPCYLKFNSYGEFVFDWAWADAYQRSGLAYYPKLLVASPYTPATGMRILTGDSPRRGDYAAALIRGATEAAGKLGVSSMHWLFTTGEETDWLERAGSMRRMGCQFHWRNRGYGSFDDLLGAMTAEKRKKIRRGFLPTPTWSAHWIADGRFRDGIGRFLDLELADMEDYLVEMRARSPFKQLTDGQSAP